MFKAKIQKIGGSLTIIIPYSEVDYNEFKEGQWVQVGLSEIKDKMPEIKSIEFSGDKKKGEKDEATKV